ncbi:MAG TPA: metallophosphoesterase [Acidimicrobiia bacterium]|nr:metallophosphoesterase [Acidimicrobiia bacterium]
MARRVGLSSNVTARDQLSHDRHPEAGIQPLPDGQGGRAGAGAVGIAHDTTPLTFLVIGDHGGVKDPDPQNAVSNAMQARVVAQPVPSFVYSVGDIVYYNGDATEYGPQFYEAYGHLQLPIVGIPGNHDGDTTDGPSRTPLDTFMANFCSASPALPKGNEEYGRDTETQPYCDWTLQLAGVTIVGVYTNVPSGGHLETVQTDWLTAELKAAATDRPLIVTLHHPPYSIDAMHGGSAKMASALDAAFQASGRTPDLVLSGHVHDYQRFTRVIGTASVPYIVIGNGGYHNLHRLAADAQPGEELSPGVTFEYGDDKNWGYLELTVQGSTISGSYTSVTKEGAATAGADTWSTGA